MLSPIFVRCIAALFPEKCSASLPATAQVSLTYFSITFASHWLLSRKFMSASQKTYVLKLYVAGNTPSSKQALNMLNTILEKEFQGVYALKVIDVLKNPQLAEEDKILATPTLAKILPPPVRKIIGDLSDREKVLIGLDLLYDELQEDGLLS
jgi:circadian clock protein KaiB